MAQKLSEILADSEIEYDVHPKVLAKLYREAGWWYFRPGKPLGDEKITGLDLHTTLETLRADVLSAPEVESSSTARLKVVKHRGPNAPVMTLEYYVRIGSEYINVENDEPSGWVQETLPIDNGGYL